jgi:hypothetical protein
LTPGPTDYREATGAPAPAKHFKAIKQSTFDGSWDRRRGAAVRLMTVRHPRARRKSFDLKLILLAIDAHPMPRRFF